MNNRDHRKITVIDGRVAYTGGYNLADEYFNITITTFPNMNSKFDCAVNNECRSKEDPLDELQETIDSKNKKISNYLKKCDKCFLLVYIPDVSKGNYCHFFKRKEICFYFRVPSFDKFIISMKCV